MLRFTPRALTLAVLLTASAVAQTYDDPAKTDDDFPFVGEYVGTTVDGAKWGVQVIALGDGKFRGVAYPGGLPGDGYSGGEIHQVDGVRDGKHVVFKSDNLTSTVADGVISVRNNDGEEGASLKRVERKSPTLEAKPPAGAVVLFDGKNADAWVSAKDNKSKAAITKDGLLVAGANSKETFGDCMLHVEFRLPYMPKATGQGRGNSGVYLQGRYEVQVLDSFGLSGENNECGGIYSIRKPDVNMCLPPLVWQTYDIDFTAARFDAAGKKTANARMTVKHNGVVIHDNVEVPKTTTAAPNKEGPEPGFLHLQDHGNPVRYRNVWAVKK